MIVTQVAVTHTEWMHTWLLLIWDDGAHDCYPQRKVSHRVFYLYRMVAHMFVTHTGWWHTWLLIT